MYRLQTNFLVNNFPQFSLPARYNFTITSVYKQTQKILTSGARVLLYYGDTDAICNFIVGQKFAAELGYEVCCFPRALKEMLFQLVDPKQPWTLNGTLAGFKTTYDEGLTFATVRGVGHLVPQWAPRRAQYLIKQFVGNQPI